MQIDSNFDPYKKFRRTDKITAKWAALQNLPNKGTQRRKLLAIHLDHPEGLTNDELEKLTTIQLNSLSTRVSQLCQGGWLEDSGEMRPTHNGVLAVVWRATLKADRCRFDDRHLA